MAARREETDAHTKALRETMDPSHKEMVAEVKPKVDVKTMA
jgi:hypothetical protein